MFIFKLKFLKEISGNFVVVDHYASSGCMIQHLKYMTSLLFDPNIRERDQN